MDRQKWADLYSDLYQEESYRMGVRRKDAARKIVSQLEPRGYLLDVGTGRGELLDIAEQVGHRVHGTEAVPYLCGYRVTHALIHKLPFKDESYDHVTCFDVMEHLVREDLEPALKELYRVAKVSVTVSCSELPSIHNGIDIHISKMPAAEWYELIRSVWGDKTKRIIDAGASPCFQVYK